eukprot:TRINITY_DN466_c0_g1_i1.p2 TRINITY_DN466_c0_g1~~TRINITY_DN466_c0_g1_i1.p2  ORF type:complete len:178 (-),score=29.73 TRINITY_DN466_c0_g1_i1:188-721(-)
MAGCIDAGLLGTLLEKISVEKSCPELAAFESLRVPSITIADYLRRIAIYSHCSPECFVFALIYLDRLLMANPGLTITQCNVHRLIITSVLIAAKARDDTYYSNSYYASIGGITTKELNRLELMLLDLLQYNLFVTPEVFAQYRTKLQNFTSEVVAPVKNETEDVAPTHARKPVALAA